MIYTKQNFKNGQTLEAEHLNHMEGGIAANAEAIKALKTTETSVETWVDLPITYTDDYFWNTQAEKAVLTQLANNYYWASEEIPVVEGEQYHIVMTIGSSTKTSGITLTDDEHNIIFKTTATGAMAQIEENLIIPEGATKLLLTPYAQNNADVQSVITVKKKTYIQSSKTQGVTLDDLYVSFVGDSISALKGYIPNGNEQYYTGSNQGVSSVFDMWWHKFCEETNAKPLIVDAWSGRLVTSGIRTTKTEASDVGCCRNLHSYVKGTSSDYDLIVTADNISTLRKSPFFDVSDYAVGDYLKRVNPNIIVIAMGVNDYSYQAPLGEWDGTSQLDLADTSNFKSAYANMLVRMHEEYPNALIYCLSPFFVQRITTNKWDVNRNELGLTFLDYENAIKDVSDLLQAEFIDMNNIGFNRYNYYPTFCIDSSSTPTHPNALGQKVIGVSLAKRINASGYIDWLKGNIS